MKAHARHPGRLWPTLAQEQLLKAALGDGEDALQAFYAWRQGVDLDGELGYPVLRLLPLVYHNLQRLGLHDPLLGRLKGVYRRAWCENQTLFFAMHPLVQQLREAGVELLMLKGAALVLSYYGNHALRPMSDFDLGVRMQHLPRAVDVLTKAGWTLDSNLSADGLRYFHAAVYLQGSLQADLHYHFLHECVTPAADQWFWSDIEAVDFQGMPVWQLAPTALLLHTVVHGVRWNEEPPIRWIADAVTVLRQRGGEVNWERLLAFADSQRLTYRLALGLTYLAEHFAIELPESVQTHLQQYRPGVVERIANTAVLGDVRRGYAHPVAKQAVLFAEYCGLAESADPLRLLWGFSHYLRYCWGLRGRLEILPAVFNGLRRRCGWR